MGKPRHGAGVQNKHLYIRASYLHQAVALLSNQSTKFVSSQQSSSYNSTTQTPADQHKAVQNLGRQLATDLRAISLKAQIRQGPELKRAICKFCDTLQVEGQTCVASVENLSKGGKKPWADVLVIKCLTCANVKRYPIAAPRQKRNGLRNDIAAKCLGGEVMDTAGG